MSQKCRKNVAKMPLKMPIYCILILFYIYRILNIPPHLYDIFATNFLMVVRVTFELCVKWKSYAIFT